MNSRQLVALALCMAACGGTDSDGTPPGGDEADGPSTETVDVEAMVPVMVPCAAGTCEVADLVAAPSSVTIGGTIDLLGPEQSWDYLGFGAAVSTPAGDDARWPAVLVRLKSTGGTGSSTSFALVSVKDPVAVTLTRDRLDVSYPDGRGSSTGTALQFVRETPDEPLTITYRQTSHPSRGAKPYMPGPPVYVFHRFKEGKYEMSEE